ncbi:hypothetical protein SASPL_131163 [Salvia splendens]|uniref:Transmembrane protein n=1 Tax=Salvia splendens TaxID=180675 RepID=A0A8X8X7A5_SALSN|nr:uncharacterized protein LOC121754560 [Salvia splendens]KAG6408160.1 hypothetical protein SASPL_131163 [Salvia splendens]
MEHLNNIYFILIESVTIIFSWKKLFTQITFATILPLSLLSLLHAHISKLLFSNIQNPSFNNINPNKWRVFLFNAAYIVLFLALSLVSTTAVVEAVARVYTSSEPRFTEVMRVALKVWKRVTATLLWSLLLLVSYNAAAFALISPWIPYSLIFFSAYAVGFVYISVVWHLASVVSVLEDLGGADAMIKGMGLVKGRMVISGVVFFLLNLCFVCVEVVFERYVVVGIGRRIGCGIVCLLVFCGITLLGLVTQTVVYFECKLYHGEIIIIPIANSKDARVDLGDYAPLIRSNEVDRC